MFGASLELGALANPKIAKDPVTDQKTLLLEQHLKLVVKQLSEFCGLYNLQA